MRKSEKITVSVIIPAYNDNSVLAKSIEYLNNQDYPLDQIELIVVDDCSDEKIMDFAGNNVRSKIVRHDTNKGQAGARNTGIIHSQNDLLIFLDSDILACKNLVSSHVNAYKKGKLVNLGTVNWHPDVKTNHFTKFGKWFEFNNVFDKPELDFDDFSAANFSVGRKELTDSGIMFDEMFRKYGLEDIEFAYRLKKTGFKFNFVPSAEGLHYRKATFGDQIRRAKKSVESILYFLNKYQDAEIARKLKYLPRSVYKKYQPLLQRTASVAEKNIIKIENNFDPTPFDREFLSVCGVYLIEYAPLDELHMHYVHLPYNYDCPYKNTAIDWALRVDLMDRMTDPHCDADSLFAGLIGEVPDLYLRQSLCHQAGRYFILKDNDDEAMEIMSYGLDIGLEPNKDSVLMMYLSGSILKKQGLLNQAQSFFNVVIEQGEKFIHKSQMAGAYYHLGDIFARLPVKAKAETCLNMALKFCPSHSAAKKALRNLK